MSRFGTNPVHTIRGCVNKIASRNINSLSKTELKTLIKQLRIALQYELERVEQEHDECNECNERGDQDDQDDYET